MKSDKPNTAFAAEVEAALSHNPSALALAQYYRDGELIWRTRGEVLTQARTVAYGLVHAGLMAAEPVLIMPFGDGEVDAAICIVAAVLVGCPPLVLPALDGGFSNATAVLTHAQAITDARVVLVATRNHSQIAAARDLVEASGAPVMCLHLAALETATVVIELPRRANRIARCHALQLTSGTTGASRVCIWHAPAMRTAIAGVAHSMALGPGDRFFSWSGLHHTVGLLNFLFVSLLHGIPATFMSPQVFAGNPAMWLRGLHASGATITAAPNFALRQIADRVDPDLIAGLSLSGIRAIWNAGERVLPSSISAMLETLSGTGLRPETLRANYGLAENTGGATFSSTGDSPLLVDSLDAGAIETRRIAADWSAGARRSDVATVGAPWPGLSVLTRDDYGRALSERTVGQIVLDSPSRFEGYLYDQAATDAMFEGKLLLTGDLGYLRHGQLFWIGRSQDAINIRGRKIDPDEFTAVLEDIEGVDAGRFAAFGAVDPERGTERIVLIVELTSNDAKTQALRAIRRSAAEKLGVVPDEVVTLAPNTLATTISGKRRHRHYRQLWESGGAQFMHATEDGKTLLG
ncbi:MAG: AMP-binding protein [Paracoccaceae bacterium]|nr:AMP-binding protein [Paracoccaceae bacterium]